MSATWRLLDTGAGPGDWNMAVDEAMLEAHRQGLVPPTLRVYRWSRPTLSLGYAQKLEGLDVAALRAASVDVVRRPTGGRAVLHVGDLTYAVVASGLPDGVSASYRVIAGALVEGLARCGLAPAIVPGATRPGRSAACFASSTRADLVVDGRKVVGSAQLRREGAVLQHGTIYLERPTALAARLLPDERDVADLTSLTGTTPAAEAVRDALAAGIARTFGVSLAPGALTPEEAERAAANVARYRVSLA